jgi:hypothetical protein
MVQSGEMIKFVEWMEKHPACEWLSGIQVREGKLMRVFVCEKCGDRMEVEMWDSNFKK